MTHTPSLRSLLLHAGLVALGFVSGCAWLAPHCH